MTKAARPPFGNKAARPPFGTEAARPPFGTEAAKPSKGDRGTKSTRDRAADEAEVAKSVSRSLGKRPARPPFGV
jgi:hypothetical protein